METFFPHISIVIAKRNPHPTFSFIGMINVNVLSYFKQNLTVDTGVAFVSKDFKTGWSIR